MWDLVTHLWRLTVVPHLPPISWRLWEAGGVIQSESKCLRTWGANGVDPSLRAEEGEMKYLSSVMRQEGQILPSSTFWSIQGLSGLDDTFPHREEWST